MKLIIALFIVMFALVGCKKAVVIEQEEQIRVQGYEAISTIKGNTIYRIPIESDTRCVYISMRDSDSTISSMVVK